MFCEKCGAQLPDGAAFCTQCGATQAPVPQPAQQQENSQPMQQGNPQPMQQGNPQPMQQGNVGYQGFAVPNMGQFQVPQFGGQGSNPLKSAGLWMIIGWVGLLMMFICLWVPFINPEYGEVRSFLSLFTDEGSFGALLFVVALLATLVTVVLCAIQKCKWELIALCVSFFPAVFAFAYSGLSAVAGNGVHLSGGAIVMILGFFVALVACLFKKTIVDQAVVKADLDEKLLPKGLAVLNYLKIAAVCNAAFLGLCFYLFRWVSNKEYGFSMYSLLRSDAIEVGAGNAFVFYWVTVAALIIGLYAMLKNKFIISIVANGILVVFPTIIWIIALAKLSNVHWGATAVLFTIFAASNICIPVFARIIYKKNRVQ